jgi:hypothetical protein
MDPMKLVVLEKTIQLSKLTAQEGYQRRHIALAHPQDQPIVP